MSLVTTTFYRSTVHLLPIHKGECVPRTEPTILEFKYPKIRIHRNEQIDFFTVSLNVPKDLVSFNS